MKFKLLINIFCLVFSNVCAQQSELYPPVNLYKYDINAVDSGNFRVLYAMNALDINDIKTYDDIQRLEIGSKMSKYYSYYVFNNDSLKRDFVKKNKNAGSIPRQPGVFGKKDYVWSLITWTDYFKDFGKNTLTEYALMPHSAIPSYQCSEEIPVQTWELQDDTLTVCGYLCQKATCRFRGNDFIAWFAPELPISNGPWKFGGLPGLILKVQDKDRHYIFESIKIENHTKKFLILMFDDKRYQKTERTKLRQLEKEIHADYFRIGGWTRMDGTPLKFEPIPYHPLELE